MKWLVVGMFIAILFALAAAGRALLRDGRDGAPKSDRMLHALALRIGLSVALFLFILVAYKLGWIRPTGLPLVR
jgi:Protein of unknown function (DUF2909)